MESEFSYRQGEILQRLFHLLKGAPDGMKPKDAIHHLMTTMELSEYEKGNFPSGGMRFDKIVRFLTVDAVKAGWMSKEGNRWIITPAGVAALTTFKTPEELQKNVKKLYNAWKKKNAGIILSGAQAADEPEWEEAEKKTEVTYEEARDQAQEGIDAFLHDMDPYEFQKLVADLLNAMGYHVIWISSPGKDGGTDLLAYVDPLGIQGPRIKVQAKQQQKAVSEPDLKSFMANIGQHDSGIFFCTGGFTAAARKYARTQENKRIMLVDSVMLVKLWISNLRNLGDQSWGRLPLTPIYFLTPSN